MGIPIIEWAAASRPLVLNSGEIHIWRFDMSDLADSESELRNLLSADECNRADKFHFEKDRVKFVIRRGVLRTLLGEYLKINPTELRFVYNNFDKPGLEMNMPIAFNASSSKEIGIIVLTLNTRIGIDVEFVDRSFPKLEIAERYFSEDEVDAIRKLPPEMQTTAFFDCWTKKEAYVKAIGDGMSFPLPNLAISSETTDLFSVTAKSEETKGWNFESFFAEEDHIASVVYEGELKKISYFSWTR